MKKIFLTLAVIIFHFSFLTFSLVTLSLSKCNAQSWNTTGNAGTTAGTNFIGTTDNKDFVFKTFNTEKGRVKANGLWQFGATNNLAKIDSGGNLSFSGTAAYKVGGNRYAFQYAGNPNYGLFFNSSAVQYEFKNSGAIPIFYVNANNGDGTFKGTLKVGTYTLPSTDGTNGQLLKTNGAGVLTWSSDNGGASQWTTSGSNIYYNTGNIGIGTTTPASKLHIVSFADASQITLDANFTQNNANPLIKLRNYAGTDLLWIHSDNALNTFVGVNAGRVNYAAGGATYNSFIGSNAGYSNTSGNYNTATGTNALYYNTTGSNNSAIGSYALYSNTSGYWNAADGESALRSNTSGHSNTANGVHALYTNSTGYYNTATGTSVLVSNTSGISNTSSGYQALLYNNIGSSNSSCGIQSLLLNTSGSYNTAIGSVSQYNNSTGTGNTSVGHYSLYSNSVGSYNSTLGYGAGCNPGQNPSNFTAIGYNAGHVGGNSNEMEIGNTSCSWIGGQSGFFNYSDQRIKDNIQSNVPGLSFIKMLNPVTYNLNIHRQNEICGINDTAQWEGKYDIEKIIQTGFLAQEVELAAIENNYDFNGVKAPAGNGKLYSIQYASFVVPLVKAVQELDSMNTDLKTSNEVLKSENKSQQTEIGDLQKQLVEIKSQMQQFDQSLSQCCMNYNSSTQPGTTNPKRETPLLEQNIPNPFSQNTVIKYYLPQTSKSGVLKIYSLEGIELRSFSITQTGFGQITVTGSSLGSGVYVYTLLIDGKAIDTKQMILTRE